ncbi:MAG: Uncharacterized protein XD58_0793 [Thermotoga sp. 50_1627]|uniref:hypothetical protein n=1 Tax=Pseudothermotoga sp. TaxID=2033661 RepID=UPI00076CCC68|nr:MAG: Uncharacterized protein XD45_1127 [Thermotoga sp. 50_64]KUK25171.1 MAG: Uncharacterized protein XD58_0793 [Thermotoga sp. 50_1627]MBC7116873.1 hypothetical protein [Pseudothermotoga sp.]MDK2923648.1 hypothetical protein [Pseudothermotoga sp.]HBT39370.1 hypothetical protein [Pseudothermotoga sp.]
MKSTRSGDWLLSLTASLLSLLIVVQDGPWWVYLTVPGAVLFVSLLSNKRSGCVTPLLSVMLFLSNWILFYVIVKDSLRSFLIALCLVALVDVLASKNNLTWLWLIVLGVALNFSSWIERWQAATLFVIVLLVVVWSKVRLEKRWFFILLFVSILCALLFVRLNYSIMAQMLRLIPQKSVQEAKQTVEITPAERVAGKSSNQSRNRSRVFDIALERIFFPIFLILFGVFLLTLSLKLFKLKGTLLLLLLGAVTFAVVLSLLSLVFSIIKPEFELTRAELAQDTVMEQSPQTSIEFVESTPVRVTQTQRDPRRIVDFLNWTSVTLLIFAGVFMIYLTVYVSKNVGALIEEHKSAVAGAEEGSRHEESLKFDPSERFVAEAYWWLRNKFFAGFNHLTPYEVLNMKGSFEPFGRLTDIYVKLRYGNKRLTNEEIEAFYENLLTTVEWLKNRPQGEK